MDDVSLHTYPKKYTNKGSRDNWGEPERAPHLSVLREKPRTYVCMNMWIYIHTCRYAYDKESFYFGGANI